MMQMHYFYEISKSGSVSRTKGSGWPESRDGLPLFTENPRRVLLGNPVSSIFYYSETGLTLRAKVGRQLLKHAGRRDALPAQ